jgi:hypothetical protein
VSSHLLREASYINVLQSSAQATIRVSVSHLSILDLFAYLGQPLIFSALKKARLASLYKGNKIFDKY